MHKYSQYSVHKKIATGEKCVESKLVAYPVVQDPWKRILCNEIVSQP